MYSKILYLPLDERPCNYIYPQYIAQIGCVDYAIPPLELMGDFKKAAKVEALWDWVFENASTATHMVVSLDLMIYGGIVPSRLHHQSIQQCEKYINKLEELNKKFPDLIIYAFQLITRAPARNGSGEEPHYYEQYGYDIYRYGVISDMELLNVADECNLTEKQEILKRVPKKHLDDFINRRKVNFQANLKTISLAKNKVIKHLIIPLDDCKEYGYAPAERKELARYLDSANLLSQVAMYPGADEIGCTLIAKAICDCTHVTPKIWLDYDSNKGMLTIPSYEDRTIGETAPHHILNGGGQIALFAQDCDAVMFIHPPTEFTQRLEKELDRTKLYLECERNLPAFYDRFVQYQQINKPCFLADCAIPNGSDKCLMHYLHEKQLLAQLQGYSGWNTSSNALGTVMAHAIAYVCAEKSGAASKKSQQISEEFRLYRYIEDWGYMVEVRSDLTKQLKNFGNEVSSLNLRDSEPNVAKKASEMLQEFTNKYFPEYDVKPAVTMLWNRMFEVDLRLSY